jgi:hypothetical protein
MTTRTLPLNSRIVPGLLVAAAGVLLTLHNLDVIHIQGLWRFWPLILIALGVSQLVSNRNNPAVGIILLVTGAFFLLANFDLINIRLRDLRRFWPLILIALGISQLARSQSRNLTGGLILLGLGVYFQLSALDLIDLTLWQLWPVILIVIGIGMVQKALQGRMASR